MWISVFIACSTATITGQSTDKSLRGNVTIKTSGRTVAVYGKADVEFLFCLDQDQAGKPQTIEFTGPARVLYRSAPIAGIPAGVTISGPEPVANTLAVVADDGRAWVFVAKNDKPLLAPGDKAAAAATRVPTTVVRRVDWSSGSGPRRGTDVAGCLQPAG